MDFLDRGETDAETRGQQPDSVPAMGAELFAMPNGVYITVESPETGRLGTVNLTHLLGSMPGVGDVFREWSAFHVQRFRQTMPRPVDEPVESDANS